MSKILLALVLAFVNIVANAAAPKVLEPPLRAHLAFLADDLLEGRGTGQRGGDISVAYLESQLVSLGLQPVKGNSFKQKVNLVGSQLLPSSKVTFSVAGQTISPQLGEQIVVGNSTGSTDLVLDAPLVFVGYGVRAPEEKWDDFKGMNLKGKILLAMVNDPQATAKEPDRFAGKSLTYYGRWTYKFEEARRQGAAGILLIHTNASASYGWNVPRTSFSHERFSSEKGGNPIEGWLQEDQTSALLRAAGVSLDELRALAESREFVARELPISVHAELHSQVRKIAQFNVLGMVPGTDAKLKTEAVVYSAHWDHLGVVEIQGAGSETVKQIWNGAVDNASGSAALLAMAQAAITRPAKRTQIFLWPCAEEQYLLGSEAYVNDPPWPLAKTAADLNLDSMNFVGETRDIGVAGSERSSLFASAKRVAKQMGLKIAPTVPDLGGAYFRADHFNFARAGVPAFNVGSAVFSGDGHFEYVEDEANSEKKSAQQMRAFKNDYHTVRDRYDPNWNLKGMLQQAQFTLNLGWDIANAREMPTWGKGQAFGLIKR